MWRHGQDLEKVQEEDLEQVLKYAALFWEQEGNYVQNEFFYFCSIGLGGEKLPNIALAERSGSKAKITTIYPHEEYDNLPESEKEKVSQLDKNNTIFVYSAAQAGSGVANHFDTFKPEQAEFTQALIDVYVDRIVYELISSLRENNMQAVVNRLEQLNRIAPHVIKNLNEILLMPEEGQKLTNALIIRLKHTIDFNSLVISQILKKPKNSSS